VLAGRRDKICRYWFDRVAPLDFFVVRADRLFFQDLALRHDLYDGEPRYRARVRGVDADRKGDDAAWSDLEGTSVGLDLAGRSEPFVEIEVRVDRGDGFGPGVKCYVATASRRVVEVRRDRD
jgi:hypothetical protein